MLEKGLTNEKKYKVTADNTAEKLKSGELPVLATPALICMAEETAAELARDFIPETDTTVGTKISFSHLAASPVGMDIKISATVSKVDGRRLAFDIEAFDNHEKIGEGKHERFIVNKEKFVSKTEGKLNV